METMRALASAIIGVITVGGVVVFSSASSAMSESDKPRGGVSGQLILRCEVPVDPVLCNAVVKALRAAQSAPVNMGEASAGASDTVLTLQVSTYTSHAISARLSREAGSEGPAKGPQINFDVMDRGLSPSLLAQFSNDLVKASGSLFSSN